MTEIGLEKQGLESGLLESDINHYHPRMRVGNVFSHVCLLVCVCLSVYLSVCPSVQAITYEPLDVEISFLVYLGQDWVSRSLGQGQGHMRKNYNFSYFKLWIICIWLQVINEVKVTHQGECHIKVKVKMSTSFPILCQILLISTHYFSVCGYRSLIRSSSYIKVKVILRSKWNIYIPSNVM